MHLHKKNKPTKILEIHWIIMYLAHSSSVPKTVRIHYVEYGYRNGELNFWNVFNSLFTMHNETTNIWSHLIGFICMSVAGINVSIDLFSKGTSLSEIFAIELYIFCACSCLLLSSIYHWFGCLSEQCHHCLLRLDLTGVALLVSGSFLPGVFYGIKCTYACLPIKSLIMKCAQVSIASPTPNKSIFSSLR